VTTRGPRTSTRPRSGRHSRARTVAGCAWCRSCAVQRLVTVPHAHLLILLLLLPRDRCDPKHAVNLTNYARMLSRLGRHGQAEALYRCIYGEGVEGGSRVCGGV
jgi:hypothetical protein